MKGSIVQQCATQEPFANCSDPFISFDFFSGDVLVLNPNPNEESWMGMPHSAAKGQQQNAQILNPEHKLKTLNHTPNERT